MTRLTCSVSTCASHCDGYCCQHSIKVGSPCATMPEETLCESFTHKGKGEVSNATQYSIPNQHLDVYCTAENCAHYGKGNHCTAKDVVISGGTVNSMDSTCCTAFQLR